MTGDTDLERFKELVPLRRFGPIGEFITGIAGIGTIRRPPQRGELLEVVPKFAKFRMLRQGPPDRERKNEEH